MDNKPLVSFLLFAYKQEKFICEAIKGALSQTYEPLEIIISDDCSPDKTFEIIKSEVGKYCGPHNVILNRNEKNLGFAAHINRVFAISRGEFFVMAAGDDISLPQRTKLLVNRWLNKNEPVDLVCSYFEDMDANGISTPSTYGLVKKNVVFVPDITHPVQKWMCGATGACAGYSRILYDKYGPLDSRIIAEDWIFSFRAWLESGIGLIEEPLVRHRTHDKCLSIIHRDYTREENREKRRLLRKTSSGAKLARARDWLRALQISGRMFDEKLEGELEQWSQLLELEFQAYDMNRFQAFKAAVKSLKYRGGGRNAVRLFVRHVLGYY